MFKLESYITPILLSYVDKYIKNFRPEDSQVSLWGGDATFHNLDLRLEVLEQELQLPFSFVSGHIHELTIHVPWTKLASEPIHITINTIECTLKLRGDDSSCSDAGSHASGNSNSPGTSKETRKKITKREELVAPPGYVQGMINKIVSNIRITCNNLILKYVEEDIVLSVNVKTVTLQSANNKWEPAFTDVNTSQFALRKLINLVDLTICLDKRNASGKIELYQEPLLYRCSTDVHLLRAYHSTTAKRASTTRIDFRCSRMDFSLSEQQIPMLMRLVRLALALHARELRPDPTAAHAATEEAHDSVPDAVEESGSEDESWAGWAWSWVPSLSPADWNEDWNGEQVAAYKGHINHIGMYVAQATISLKVTEQTSERSYYGPKKVKFVPFLILRMNGCSLEMVKYGMEWFNMQLGVSYAALQPFADCFCGVREHNADFDQPVNPETCYLLVGKPQDLYLSDSLFDETSVENRGGRRKYSLSWDNHLGNTTESLLVERSPAFAMDYLYQVDKPEFFGSESLSDLGSDLEYSNLAERTLCRFVVGESLAIRLCSGLTHRIQMIVHAGKLYDYSPYSTPKPEPTLEELPPASSDDFDALNEYIPTIVYQVTVFHPTIYIHLNDHPNYDPAAYQSQHRKRRSASRKTSACNLITHLPILSVDCICLYASITRPMYPRRLVTTTCKLPTPPPPMFHACHNHTNIKLFEFSAHLEVNPTLKPTTILVPSTITLNQQVLLMPQYWSNRADLFHCDRVVQAADSVALVLTNAKMVVVACVLQSLVEPEAGLDVMLNTTLLKDAAKDTGVEFLEIYVEALSYHHVSTPNTECHNLQVGAVRAFVLDTPETANSAQEKTQPPQALVLTGPEMTEVETGKEVKPLLSLTLQCPLDPNVQAHPPLILCNLRELRACIDPLLWRWLRYSPTPLPGLADSVSRVIILKQPPGARVRSTTTPDTTAKRPTPAESVHSSSDQQGPSLGNRTRSDSAKRETVTVATNTSDRLLRAGEAQAKLRCDRECLLRWFPVWSGLVLCGDIAPCVVYLPAASLSAVGVRTIEEALERYKRDVLVARFPHVTVRSAVHRQTLCAYAGRLPVVLPEEVWVANKISFPWTLSLSDASLYTLQSGEKLHFLKPVSCCTTVSISTKYRPGGLDGQPSEQLTDLAALNLCVYVDTTPVKVAISETQMQLMSTLLSDLLQVASAFTFRPVPASHPAPPSTEGVVLRAHSPTSPTTFQESSMSQNTTSNLFSRHHKPADLDVTHRTALESGRPDVVNLTSLMQWTLARLTVTLYTEDCGSSDKLKLQLDMEDIITSLELQDVFMKLKFKVASANVQHYRRPPVESRWHAGSYMGLVMRGNDDPAAASGSEENGGFVSVLFTRAKCRNVHNKWGATANRKQSRPPHGTSQQDLAQQPVYPNSAESHYISEIVVKLQAVDFLLSPATLASFARVLHPLAVVSRRPRLHPPAPGQSWTLDVNNHTLPLLYVETRSLRLILPAARLVNVEPGHDVALLQLDAVSLAPQAENPLGRVVIRADLYAMAERSRTLTVPGADVEDRQYQLNVSGFSVNTGKWRDLERCLLANEDTGVALKTMSENPAVAWNSLVRGGESLMPHMTLSPVVARIELCIIVAPAIVDRNYVLVCGHSFELNALTDIEVSISTTQLTLASTLLTEVVTVCTPMFADEETVVGAEVLSTMSDENLVAVTEYRSSKDSGLNVDGGFTSSPMHRLVMSPENTSIPEKSSGYHEGEDSGSNAFTRQTFQMDPVAQSNDRLTDVVPVEMLLTAGSISLVLYEILEVNTRKEKAGKTKATKGFKSLFRKKIKSEKKVEAEIVSNERPVYKFQPLMYVLLAQPHLFLSRLASDRKIQASCFDFGIRISTWETSLDGKDIPTVSDFPDIILETKNGDPHPGTGIPPSFVTSKWSQSGDKLAKIEIEMGRPMKLNCSLARWTFLETIYDKMRECFVRSDNVSATVSPPVNLQLASHGTLVHSSGLSDHRAKKSVSIVEHANTMSSFGMSIPEERDAEIFSTDGSESEGIQSEFSHRVSKVYHSNKSEERLKGWIFALVSGISVTTQQIVLEAETENKIQLCVSVNGVSVSVTSVPGRDRVVGNASLDCLTLATRRADRVRLLVNPWSCAVEGCMEWEPWLPRDAPPHVQFTADSDCFILDIGPERIRCLNTLWMEYKPVVDRLMSTFPADKSTKPSAVDETLANSTNTEQEQHYRDDLRAGAFQFVDGNGSRENVPLPYQVVFWQDPPTMAWRYPQPRTLTRVDVFPVPFKVASLSPTADQQVFCWLQYWSEARSRFQPYAQFTLSECEVRSLALPGQTVARTWRVQLALTGEDDDTTTAARLAINPKTLAACMRVDSFFSPRLVPRVQAALNISSMQVAAYNHVDGYRRMPAPMRRFTADGFVPEEQGFLSAQLDNASLYYSSWGDGKQVFDVGSHVRVDCIDYAFLTQQCVVEPFRAQLTVTVDDKIDVSCVTKPITIRFSMAAAQTLAISTQLWAQALREHCSERDANNGAEKSDEYQVLLTRYVVCNDTNKSLRFCQSGTDEDILLKSRHCHLYSWRTQKASQLMRVSVEGAWIWTEPFAIDIDGIKSLPLQGCGEFALIVKVSSLSTTQRQVTIFGQLTITNLLSELVECRILEVEEDVNDSQLLDVPGDTTAPTLLLDSSKTMAIRIRLNRTEDVSWSGDIPLRINMKTGAPWLVKIPLPDRSYTCVWCHITKGPCGTILAALYPLYSIRSLLPVSAQLVVDTPGLKAQTKMLVEGGGARQQLFCPGTIDHSHTLTFQLDSATPTPCVPLSYAMLERRKLGKTDHEVADIDDVVQALRRPAEPKDWPFAGEDYAGVKWVSPQQPETDIHVRYEASGPFCATLQVHIQPWCLFLNTLGVATDVVIDETLACRIPHQGVLTPPRLEATFHLAFDGIDTPRHLYKSPPLQLHKPGKSFYMPRIAGLIPVVGSVQLSVLCGYTAVMACMTSKIVPDDGEMRVVHVKPSYAITNRGKRTLKVACVSLHDTLVRRPVPSPSKDTVVVTLPPSDENAHPLVHWSMLDDGDTDLVAYVMVSSGAGWSRPLQMSDKVARRGFSIPSRNGGDVPYVLVTQERDGQLYMSIHQETHPHIYVRNQCTFGVLIAEAKKDGGGPVEETPHLDWHCRVGAGASAHYTLPSAVERFPTIAPSPRAMAVVLSMAESPTEDQQPHWSIGVNVAEAQDQFVRLPCHGDVKVRVETKCMTTWLTVETVSHVEISARDIRSRLTQQHITKLASRVNVPDVAGSSVADESKELSEVRSYAAASSISGALPLSHSPSTVDVSLRPSESPSTVGVSLRPSDMTLMPSSDTELGDWSVLSLQLADTDTSSFSSAYNVFESRSKALKNVGESIPSFSEDVNEVVQDDLNVSTTVLSLNCFVRGFSFTLIENVQGCGSEQMEITSLSLDNICVSLEPQIIPEKLDDLRLTIGVGDIQLDNQLFQRGGFDFPVVLVSQTPNRALASGLSLGIPARQLVGQTVKTSIIKVVVMFERSNKTAKHVELYIGPIGAYIEDTYLIRLSESLSRFLPHNLVLFSESASVTPSNQICLPVPLSVSLSAQEIAHPVRVRSLNIEPFDILLSVHASIKLYLALDRSPLNFNAFHRRSLETTPYRLGHALTMHYASGALFGAGWVVGSLELLGSPGGLARTLGSGLKDFVSLPCRGILLGPWGFVSGATHGSVSLLRHCAAGAVGSVTGLASSVARNLDRLTLDNEHLERTEELRRIRPQGIAQGISQGLTGLGISLLGAVGGIAHHPLQAAMAGTVSPRDVAAGVGLGIVGAITKPLSGAAELVALAGRGLLNGTGWSMQPEQRSRPMIEHAFTGVNSRLKYDWKLSTGAGLLHVVEASCSTQTGSYEAVALVLTTRALFLIDTDRDATKRVLSLSELTGMVNSADPTLLCFRLAQPLESDADAASRARVEDFVRHTSGMVQEAFSKHSGSSKSSSPIQAVNPMDAPLVFYVNPQARNYFLTILELAKRQSQGKGFNVL